LLDTDRFDTVSSWDGAIITSLAELVNVLKAVRRHYGAHLAVPEDKRLQVGCMKADARATLGVREVKVIIELLERKGWHHVVREAVIDNSTIRVKPGTVTSLSAPMSKDLPLER